VTYVIPHAAPTSYDCGEVSRRLIEGFHAMNDTVKIKRPMCCRRAEDLGGRIKEDSMGNTIRVRTRAGDSQDDFARSWLESTVNLERSSAG
jgi:hypothetical protein